MSSQKGNPSRKRGQKYQNKFAFKNSLHDTSKRTKEINSTQIHACCEKCKLIVEWKIKYKKYKPLSQAKKWYVSLNRLVCYPTLNENYN